MLHEMLGGFVQEWPTRNFGSPGDLQHADIKKPLNHTVHSYSPDRFDIRFRHWLAVRHDCQCLQSWRTEPGGAQVREQLPDPDLMLWFSGELPAAHKFDELESSLKLLV